MATSSQPGETPASAESRILPGVPRQFVTEHVDPAGLEETCSVHLDPGGWPDDLGRMMPPSICVGGSVDLGFEQAGSVARAILQLLDDLLPASAETLSALRLTLAVVSDRLGAEHTVESVSEALGLEHPLSEGDASKIAWHIGGVLMTA